MTSKSAVLATGGFAFAGACAATLVYGAVTEANRLIVERRRFRLPGWPAERAGYRIALLADLHLHDASSVALAYRAAAAVVAEQPDITLFVGDLVGFWHSQSEAMIADALAPLRDSGACVLAVAGNRDSLIRSRVAPHATARQRLHRYRAALHEQEINLLENQSVELDGIDFVGIGSATLGLADPVQAFSRAAPDRPRIVLWHEPDAVDYLGYAAHLMVSGHSHGGQFTFPWGWTPMHTKLGEKYVRGWYPQAPVPLYVSRGIGTTGYPARLGCPPEVAILELHP